MFFLLLRGLQGICLLDFPKYLEVNLSLVFLQVS